MNTAALCQCPLDVIRALGNSTSGCYLSSSCPVFLLRKLQVNEIHILLGGKLLFFMAGMTCFCPDVLTFV